MSGARVLWSVVAAWAVIGVARVAHADGPLGPQGSPIQSSAYSIDLVQGPVLAATRVASLAGAYTAIAEGADGIPFNPASASLRYPHSTTYDDFDVTGGVTVPSTIDHNDFDNNGRRGFRYDNFIWATFGGYVQHGALGLGAIGSGQNYALGALSGGPTPLDGTSEAVSGLIVRIFRVDAVASYGFLDEQLHVGGGVRVASFYGIGQTRDVVTAASGTRSLGGDERERTLFNTTGFGAQGGILWTPYRLPLRIGGAVRSPIVGRVGASRIAPNAVGDRVVGDFYLPDRIDLPWEIEWGVAFQIGPRRLNERWHDEGKMVGPEVEAERKTVNGQHEPASRAARRIILRRDRARPRRKLLVSTSALVVGPTPNAVGVESMLEKVVDRSGERATLSLRAGAEAEVIPNWVQLRLGTYMEPSRFRESVRDVAPRNARARFHGTAGVELKVFTSSVFGIFDEGSSWRVTLSGDAARDYLGWGFGFGMWH